MEIESLDTMIDLEELGPTQCGKRVYEKFIEAVGALTWSNVPRNFVDIPRPEAEYHNWTVDDF